MSNESGWVVVTLDETMAKRHGMPISIPVPKQEFEALGSAGLSHEKTLGWIKTFLGQAGSEWRTANAATGKAYDAYLAKMPPWQKAQAAFQRHDFQTAIRSLVLVTNVDPNDYSARQSLATAHAAAGQIDEALKVFDSIQDVWKGVSDFHVGYGNACMMAERRDDAIEQFVLALEAQPDCRPAMEGLVSLRVLVKLYEDPLDAGSLVFVRTDSVRDYLVSQWEKGEHDVDFFLRQVAYHEDERRFDVMLAAAEHAAGVAGNDTQEPSALAKASALRQLGRIDEARAVLSALSGSAGAHVELAQCALACDDAEAAAKELDQALELDPGHLAALTIKFLPADPTDLDSLGGALPALARYAEEHPVAGAYRILARAESRAGLEEKTLEHYVKALELAPVNEELRAEYWAELGKQGHFQGVLEDSEKLGNMNARDWKLRWSEAEALHGAGRRAEAQAAFMALNADESLHVAIRARAKRAIKALG